MGKLLIFSPAQAGIPKLLGEAQEFPPSSGIWDSFPKTPRGCFSENSQSFRIFRNSLGLGCARELGRDGILLPKNLILFGFTGFYWDSPDPSVGRGWEGSHQKNSQRCWKK